MVLENCNVFVFNKYWILMYLLNIIIIGNHEWAPDLIVKRKFKKFLKKNHQLISTYHLLLDECVTIHDHAGKEIKVYGSRFKSAWKFPPLMRDTIRKKVFDIPKDIDILLTHFPPIKKDFMKLETEIQEDLQS